MKKTLTTLLIWLLLLTTASAAEPLILNWLAYGPPPGYSKYPWTFRRETLDPLFGSKQPHFMFHQQCFKDNDPLQPTPQNVIDTVLRTAAGPIGKYYIKYVLLNIEFVSENLERNWDPMVVRESDGAYVFRVEPGAMHKLESFVLEVKAGLPDYKVGLWNHLPSWRAHMVFNGTVELRDKWWNFNEALASLDKTVDFTCPHFYWVLDRDDPQFYTHAQRRRIIQLSCFISHEIYKVPCYPCIWPECYRAFQEDPWPDSEDRRKARQWTLADAQNTVGACLKWGDGALFYSQKLRSAPPKGHTRFHFEDEWVPVFVAAGRYDRRLTWT